MEINKEYNAYIVNVKNNKIIVIAENIAEVCDKLDKKGYIDYEFEYSRSYNVLI